MTSFSFHFILFFFNLQKKNSDNDKSFKNMFFISFTLVSCMFNPLKSTCFKITRARKQFWITSLVYIFLQTNWKICLINIFYYLPSDVFFFFVVYLIHQMWWKQKKKLLLLSKQNSKSHKLQANLLFAFAYFYVHSE